MEVSRSVDAISISPEDGPNFSIPVSRTTHISTTLEGLCYPPSRHSKLLVIEFPRNGLGLREIRTYRIVRLDMFGDRITFSVEDEVVVHPNKR